MTGPEHYREAQAYIQASKIKNISHETRQESLAIAQVHASLALAAATAANIRRNGAIDVEVGQWAEVLGGTAVASRPLDRERLNRAKQALVDTGYFTPDQVGNDIAPRIIELYRALTRESDG
jgi:hypothetical protein